MSKQQIGKEDNIVGSPYIVIIGNAPVKYLCQDILIRYYSATSMSITSIQTTGFYPPCTKLLFREGSGEYGPVKTIPPPR